MPNNVGQDSDPAAPGRIGILPHEFPPKRNTVQRTVVRTDVNKDQKTGWMIHPDFAISSGGLGGGGLQTK